MLVDRLITSYSAKLGFADRGRLAAKLNSLHPTNEDHQLYLLTNQGILKPQYRETVQSFAQIQAHMLSVRVTTAKLYSLNQAMAAEAQIDSAGLFADQQMILGQVTRGIVAAGEWSWAIGDKAYHSRTAYLFGQGACYALTIVLALGVAFYVGVPHLSAWTVGLGAATFAGIVAGKYNTRFPAHSLTSAVLRLYSRKVAPWIYAVDGGYLVHRLMESNMHVPSILDSIGLEGTIGIGLGVLTAAYVYIKSRANALALARGNHINPGDKPHEYSMFLAAVTSVMSELNYLGTRMILYGAATTFLFQNAWNEVGPLGMIPVAIPLLGVGLTAYLRRKEDPSAIPLINKLHQKKLDKTDQLKTLLNQSGLFGALEQFDIPAELIRRLKNLAGSSKDAADFQKNEVNFQRYLNYLQTLINNSRNFTDIRSLIVALQAQIYSGQSNNPELQQLVDTLKDFPEFAEFKKNVAEFKPAIIDKLAAKTQEVLALSGNVADKSALKKLQVAVTELKNIADNLEKKLDTLRPDVERNYRKNASARLDSFKIFTPVWGLAAGAAAALGLDLAGASDSALLLSVIYANLYGQFATLIFNELHTIFHGVNTSQGLIGNLQASSHDLVGDREIWRLVKELKIRLVNPHTGLHERTYGLMFNVLFNRHPNISIISLYDQIIGVGANQQNHREEKKFIHWLKNELQTNIYKKLTDNLRPIKATGGAFSPDELRAVYQQLINNLKATARFYETELPEIIRRKTEDGFKSNDIQVFWIYEEVAEFVRALHQTMGRHVEDFFLQRARDLEAQLQLNQISQADFIEQLSDVAGCYDPDRIQIIPVARKSLRGDEVKVRKVENVSTIEFFRGVSVYLGQLKQTIQFVDLDNQPAAPVTDKLPAKEWIGATWSQFPNPQYKPFDPSEKLHASAFIMVPTEKILVKLQSVKTKHLSTSPWIKGVDNDPVATDGFEKGNKEITIRVNGENLVLTADEYYYYSGNGPAKTMPNVKEVLLRKGVASLPPGYQLANYTKAPLTDDLDAEPLIFTPPAYDYTTMVDKNDAQWRSYLLLTAIIERAKLDKFLQLFFKYPLDHPYATWLREKLPWISKLIPGTVYEFDNPHPDWEIDADEGLQIIDTNVELRNPDNKLIIPYMRDRTVVAAGLATDVQWENLRKMRVEKVGGQIQAVTLIYNRAQAVPLTPQYWPAYLDKLELQEGRTELEVNLFNADPQREGDASFVKICYTNDKVSFVRAKDGERPMLFHKDLTLNQQEHD